MKSKIGTALLSLIIAFGLWLYVVTVVSPEQERSYRNVQVVLEGESALRERNLMIVSDTDFDVRVDLKGSRQDLNNLNSSNLTLTADLSGIYDPGEYDLGYSVGFPGNIPAGAVTVMSKDPSTVQVTIAKRITQTIPVEVNIIGNAADGFFADKPQVVLEHQEVIITGPEEIVKQIDHAYIEVDCTDRTETLSESYRFKLRDAGGNPVDAAMITTNVEQIRIQVPVYMTKQVPLAITVNDGGGATEETSLILIDPVYIDVAGSEAALAQLEQIVLGTINLGEIAEPVEKIYTIPMPEGVTNLSGITEAAVTISFPQLAKKEFQVTTIKTKNVPEGMTADVMTKQLTVVLRGPADLIAKLTADQILVTIDLTGVENTAAVEANITFPEEFAGVGAVGKYSVNVKVTDKANTEE